MSMNEPRDREQRSVYVRRRLAVLGGLLAVIVIIALVIWKPGSTSGAEPEKAPVTSTPSGAASATPSADPADVGVCSKDDVLVEALTDKSTYGAGEIPQLSLRITNTGGASCSINVGTAAQVFTVKSGSDTYWTSTDCQVEPADAVVDLAADQIVESTAPIAWDRTRSSPSTCEGERPAVPAGGASYHLTTSIDGIESVTSKQFILAG